MVCHSYIASEISSYMVHRRAASFTNNGNKSIINHQFDQIKVLVISRYRWWKLGLDEFKFVPLGLNAPVAKHRLLCLTLLSSTVLATTPRKVTLCMSSHIILSFPAGSSEDTDSTAILPQSQSAQEKDKREALYRLWCTCGASHGQRIGTIHTGWWPASLCTLNIFSLSVLSW